MPDKPYEDVQIEGHLIDSLMMPQIMDNVMDLEGEFARRACRSWVRDSA
jgi:hypothetical protein